MFTLIWAICCISSYTVAGFLVSVSVMLGTKALVRPWLASSAAFILSYSLLLLVGFKWFGNEVSFFVSQFGQKR